MVGTSNRTAITAGRAVANAPGSAYNPLLIYARPGMGKTHLLGAIAHQVFAMNPAARIEFITLDEFVEGFHVALSTGDSDRFRARFGDADLLLVDDIQFLSRQREMQAELLRVLDVMLAGQKQVVLTSDRAPSEIESLDDRLLTRFAGGLVLDIAQPDYETRVAILQRKAEERGASFPDGVLEAVAALDIESVRELVGALNRLMAFQAVSEVPLDAAQARVLIGGLQSAAETEELVVEQAETMEFAAAGHAEMVHAGDARRVLADALPGVMLGQSDMLGGGPVDELASHPHDDGDAAHHDFGLAGEPHEYQDSHEFSEPRDAGGDCRSAGRRARREAGAAGRSRRVRRLPLRPRRHAGAPGGSVAGAGGRGDPALGRRGFPHLPARATARGPGAARSRVGDDPV